MGKMSEECQLVLILILILYLLYLNSSTYEYMQAQPYIFLPEGYGFRGQYNDNNYIEPVYRTIGSPTIFD